VLVQLVFEHFAQVTDDAHPSPPQLDNTGLMSTMYETKLPNGEKLAGSLQLKATDLSSPFKYGFAVDLS
jgi:hypothetical protein